MWGGHGFEVGEGSLFDSVPMHSGTEVHAWLHSHWGEQVSLRPEQNCWGQNEEAGSCGSGEMNPTRIHKDVGSNPDLAQSVGDLASLLWLWCRLVAIAPIQPLAWELPYEALKRKKKNNPEQRGWPYQQLSAILVLPLHDEQLKTCPASIAWEGSKMTSCPACPPVSVGPCFPMWTGRSHEGLSIEENPQQSTGMETYTRSFCSVGLGEKRVIDRNQITFEMPPNYAVIFFLCYWGVTCIQ